MEKKKKGFWTSLFTPKQCSCTVQFEETTPPQATSMNDKAEENKDDNKSTPPTKETTPTTK